MFKAWRFVERATVHGNNSGSDRDGEKILAWFVRYWKLQANFFASSVKFGKN